VNPARSLGVALFAGSDALKQLWVFIVFPIVGGVAGAVLYQFMAGKEEPEPEPAM
jgi:aquaporin Z